MTTIKTNSKSTKMVAHRGVSGIERENTVAAFVAAGNRSYYGIETDVHKTSDGKYIIIHDDSTGRVANRDISVEGSTFDELRNLKILDMDTKSERCDLCLPTLEEYIKICKKYEKKSILELKNRFAKEDIYEIIETINSLEYLDDTIIISFSLDNLIDLRDKYKNVKAQWLTCSCDETIFTQLKKYNLGLDIMYTALTDQWISKLQQNNIPINVWTCDDPKAAERFFDKGIDFITSNILE